jgi:dTDP-4-amino-4,6-dideoxy-D-galactose acyltransferase
MSLQFLVWDTQQLKIQTAKITSSHLSLSALNEILINARNQDVHLIYWVISEKEKESIEAASKLGGIVVDHKVTYLMDLDPSNKSRDDNNKNKVEVYSENTPSSDLIALSFESGKYSRFRADSHITEEQFHNIYREWIINSVNHTVADDIFIIKELKKILGMVTVGEKNSRGDIGLLAVDKDARGKQIGTTLVNAALDYFTQKNYKQSQVVTQQANIPACRLYEKCGYHIEKVEWFFHFWI